MKHTIRLYVTTRSDPVPDLDDMKSASDLAKWKKDIRKNALEIKEYSEIDEAIIDDMEKVTILECYAVIAYPPGKMTEAHDQVGGELMRFLKKNSSRLNWELEETGVSAVSVAELASKHPLMDASKLWDNFTYGLIADKSLGADEYEVDLEVIVKE